VLGGVGGGGGGSVYLFLVSVDLRSLAPPIHT